MQALLIFLIFVCAGHVVAKNECQNCLGQSTLGLVCDRFQCKHLASNTDLCSISPYIYTFCVESTCGEEFLCSDGSQRIKRYTTPDGIAPEVLTTITKWAFMLAVIGFVSTFYMRDKPPQRTRNVYLTCAMIVSQLAHIRYSLDSSIHVPCILKLAVSTLLTTEKLVMLVQLYLYKLKAQRNKKLGVCASSVMANKDIDVKSARPFYHFLDTLSGAIVAFLLYFLLHLISFALFSEASISDLDVCNTKGYQFPGAGRAAYGVGVPLLLSAIVFGFMNPAALMVFNFQLIFWLMLTTTLVVAILWVTTIAVLTLLNNRNSWLGVNFSYVSFVLFIGAAIFVDCIVPIIYYHLFYKQRSKVSDDIRAKFMVAEQQPFSMDKLTDFASNELETESVLLYQLIRAIKSQRSNILNSDFDASERLAKFIVDNYIKGGWKTLEWYDLSNITKGIASPLDLLEKETIIDALEIGVRERIILPMFARMERK